MSHLMFEDHYHFGTYLALLLGNGYCSYPLLSHCLYCLCGLLIDDHYCLVPSEVWTIVLIVLATNSA